MQKKKKRAAEFVVGHATFYKKMTKKEQQKLNMAKKRQTLEKIIWKLCTLLVQNRNWSEVFKGMKSSSCHRIDLHDNQFPGILKDLSFPCFTNIVTLVLQKNRIDNLEALTFLNMETINFIDLDDNKITQVKALGKLRWPFLRKLEIRNNFIQQMDISRMKTKHEIQKIYFDEYVDARIMTQDMGILAKLGAQNLVKLQIEGSKRIQQKRVLQVLEKKYAQIVVWKWSLFEQQINRQRQGQEVDGEQQQEEMEVEEQEQQDDEFIYIVRPSPV